MKNLIAQNRAIIAALCVNLCIAIMKFVVAVLSGSASMLSEGVHSLADTMNQIVLLVGKRQAVRPADRRHPFGYARVSFFASFCVAALLFFVGGAYSLMEAVEKIGHIGEGSVAHDFGSFTVAAAILAVSVLLEGVSLRTVLHEVAEQQRHDGTQMSLLQFFRESRNSALLVVMIEDLAAILGLMLALLGVVLTLITGNPLFDAVGGAAIGLLLIVAAFVLGREIASLIIGESLSDSDVEQIRQLVINTANVADCHVVKTVAIGSDSVLVEVDVVFSDYDNLPAADLLASIASIKAAIQALLADQAAFINTCIEPVAASSEPDFAG